MTKLLTRFFFWVLKQAGCVRLDTNGWTILLLPKRDTTDAEMCRVFERGVYMATGRRLEVELDGDG